MGLFCKGLHCAGCGKGIPAGLVLAVVLFALIGHNAGAIGNALTEAVIAIAVVVFLAAIISAVLIYRLFRMGTETRVISGRWEGKGLTELTTNAAPEWPNRPAIESRLTIPYEWHINERKDNNEHNQAANQTR